MSCFLNGMAVFFYLVFGLYMVTAREVEMRMVFPKVWDNTWLYTLAVFFWPPFIIWLRIKWRRWTGRDF